MLGIVLIPFCFILFPILVVSAEGESTNRDLIEVFESQIFASDPFDSESLSEYQTGPWSWDVTTLLNRIQTEFESKEAFIAAVEDSFELASEYRRFDEDEVASDPEKAKINRYYLDPAGSDRVRYFTHHYWVNLKFHNTSEPALNMFELLLIIHEKQDEQSDKNVKAILFWRHF